MIKINIPKYLIAKGFYTKCKIDRMRFREIPEIFDLGGKVRYEDCYALYIDNQAKMKIYLEHCTDVELNYQAILEKCAETIKAIKPNPTLKEILFIFIYLYRKGYLSATNSFDFNYNENELDFRHGLTMATGTAVCRHIASMFNDLLIHFNIFGYDITTDGLAESRETIMVCEELMELKGTEEEIDSFGQVFKERSDAVGIDDHISGNHVEVLTEHDDQWYLIDPSCFAISKVIDEDNGHPMKDVIRPWSMLATGYYKTGAVVNIYRQFKDKHLKLYQDEHTILLQQDMYYLCENNQGLLQQFSDDMSYQKQYIKTWLERL